MCSCCGEERPEADLTGLQCHPDTRLCRGCIGWLRATAGVPDATPILPTRDLDEAASFYAAAGFDVRRYEGGGFAFVERDEQSVFDLDHAPDLDTDANRAGCYLIVPDVDVWHEQLRVALLPVTDLEDQPWGMREFALTDPSGNQIRIGRST